MESAETYGFIHPFIRCKLITWLRPTMGRCYFEWSALRSHLSTSSNEVNMFPNFFFFYELFENHAGDAWSMVFLANQNKTLKLWVFFLLELSLSPTLNNDCMMIIIIFSFFFSVFWRCRLRTIHLSSKIKCFVDIIGHR